MAVPEGTSLPLTWIPLGEPRSMTDQVPSGALAQLRVQPGHARIGGRAGQVDFRLDGDLTCCGGRCGPRADSLNRRSAT